jgi:gamma-glutamylcyclotransferase (GGCT)/AIG2-like uncharacterized protein YtfP
VQLPAGDTFLLFVYGTLKRDGCRHGPLAGQVYRGEARTRPLYALYDLGEHPGLKTSEGDGQVVHGELYEVERSLLPWLDEVEGAPDSFALAPIELEGGGPAWAYYYQQDARGRPLVEPGVWRNR